MSLIDPMHHSHLLWRQLRWGNLYNISWHRKKHSKNIAWSVRQKKCWIYLKNRLTRRGHLHHHWIRRLSSHFYAVFLHQHFHLCFFQRLCHLLCPCWADRTSVRLVSTALLLLGLSEQKKDAWYTLRRWLTQKIAEELSLR